MTVGELKLLLADMNNDLDIIIHDTYYNDFTNISSVLLVETSDDKQVITLLTGSEYI